MKNIKYTLVNFIYISREITHWGNDPMPGTTCASYLENFKIYSFHNCKLFSRKKNSYRIGTISRTSWASKNEKFKINFWKFQIHLTGNNSMPGTTCASNLEYFKIYSFHNFKLFSRKKTHIGLVPYHARLGRLKENYF